MNKAVLQRGALGGVLGGIVMAMWSMIVLWLIGVGFWTALNLIAHTFWRDVPLDETFSWGGLIIGIVVHMVMSVAMGVGLALVLRAIPRVVSSPIIATVAGMVGGLVIWLIMQYGIWPVIDSAAANEFTPWVFAIGHVMFGAIVALTVSVPAARQIEHQTAR